MAQHPHAGGLGTLLWYYQYTDSRVTISPTVEFTFNAHEDIMGSASYYTKQTGAVYEEHIYDAWGGVRWSTGYGVNDGKTLVIEPNYTGHSYDPILKIYHAEARFYDGKTRQWMASDPIKSGLNWYQYCISNPTTFVDPTGLYFIIEVEDEESGDKYLVPINTTSGDAAIMMFNMIPVLGSSITHSIQKNALKVVGGSSYQVADIDSDAFEYGVDKAVDFIVKEVLSKEAAKKLADVIPVVNGVRQAIDVGSIWYKNFDQEWTYAPTFDLINNLGLNLSEWVADDKPATIKKIEQRIETVHALAIYLKIMIKAETGISYFDDISFWQFNSFFPSNTPNTFLKKLPSVFEIDVQISKATSEMQRQKIIDSYMKTISCNFNGILGFYTMSSDKRNNFKNYYDTLFRAMFATSNSRIDALSELSNELLENVTKGEVGMRGK